MTDDLEVVQKGTLNKMLAMQIRIEKLEAANLKQSCIKVDDEARIEKLEAALREIETKSDRNCAGNPFSIHGDYYRIARAALEGKDD